MIIQNVKNIVKDNQKDIYKRNAKAFTEGLKKVNGCIDAGVFDGEDSNEVDIISIWNSEKAMNSNAATKVFLKHKPNLKPYFISNTAQISKSI